MTRPQVVTLAVAYAALSVLCFVAPSALPATWLVVFLGPPLLLGWGSWDARLFWSIYSGDRRSRRKSETPAGVEHKGGCGHLRYLAVRCLAGDRNGLLTAADLG